jgi:DNA polymerase-4
VRFADFKTISRSKTIPLAVDGLQETYEVAKKLYLALKLDRARIRLIGISLEGLIENSNRPIQFELGERDKGWRQATEAMDQATARFGDGSVRPARLLSADDQE